MITRVTLTAVCLLLGLTAVSAGGQTVTMQLNRGLDFGIVSPPLGNVTVSGTTPPDGRAAWLTIVATTTKGNCKSSLRISVPASISRTTAPTTATIATSPFIATLVNPNGTTTGIATDGTIVSLSHLSGTYQLYIGTTGNFTASRAGTFSGTLTVTLGAASGC